MDKLEPILKQKFWIILGVGVILTVTGWWMATGSLSAAITTRKSEIEAAEKGIPSERLLPNDDWSAKLSTINQKQEEMVATVRRQLWDQQKAVMVWPETLQEFVVDLPYRGELGLVARDLYRSSYTFEVERVWKEARPVELDGTGIVRFPIQSMPIKKSILGDLAPKSSEIWDAQEDLWLLTPILQAIREVNGGVDATRLDASIHVINKIELMGGERATGQSSSGSTDPMGGSGGAMDPGMAMMGMGSGGGQRNADAGKVLPADFNPEEEFGNTGREGRGGGGGMGGMMSSMDMAADPGAMGGGGTEAPTTRRYVDDDEAAPFKTRAFYLSVVMDHRKVPNLISELTAGGNSPWPIEIMRVQMSRVNPDDAEGRNLGGAIAGMMPAMDSGAMPAGGLEVSGDFGGGEGFNPAAGLFPSGSPTNPAAAAMTQTSLETALHDPSMATVAIAGLIYLYRPVDPPPPVETPAVDPSTAPAEPVADAAPAAEEMAADPAAAPAAESAAEGTPMTDAAATEAAPSAAQPATPAAASPADPATPAPATATPATEGTPASPAPAAKPEGESSAPAPGSPSPAAPPANP